MGQRMTRCVFLCFMSFLCFFKLEKKQETVFYDICLETSLKKCMSLCDYVVSPHRDCIRHSMCFCAFVFFFFPKNTKTQWPNVSLSFFNNRIASDSLCVFVFLCFFSRKTQKNRHMPILTWIVLLLISAPNHLGKRLDPPTQTGNAQM